MTETLEALTTTIRISRRQEEVFIDTDSPQNIAPEIEKILKRFRSVRLKRVVVGRYQATIDIQCPPDEIGVIRTACAEAVISL